MNNTMNLLKTIYFWLLGMRSTFDRSQLQLRFEVALGIFKDHLASYLLGVD